MLRIACPWCGPRDLREFSCGGEAHIVRPRQPGTLGDDEWADYLFNKSNTKGLFRERWMHAHGCGRWFNMARNTVTDEIVAIYKIGERAPVEEDQRGVKTADSDARPELRVEVPGDQ